MKKAICTILCLTLVITALPFSTFADEPRQPAESSCPVILMPGILENLLIQNKGQPDQSLAWFSFGKTVKFVLKYFIPATYQILFGSEESISRWTVKIVREFAEPLKMNPDGTSVHDLSPVVSGAANCSYDALKKAGLLPQVTYGTTMLGEIAKKVGGDRAFVFQYDWRMSPFKVVEEFREFVADVKRLTGSDKVNVSGTSFGSEILLAYIKLYGGDGDLHNVLMNSPAYGGSEIFKEMMVKSDPLVDVHFTNLLNMIISNFSMEIELGPIIDNLPRDVGSLIFKAAVDGWMKTDFIGSPGLWGCCGVGDYDEMKEFLLDPVKNAKLIKETDRIHYELMDKTGEILALAKDYGINVFSIANEGCVLMTDMSSGDVLVDAANSTGGACLPVGETFPDDYEPEHIVCKNPEHDHVSYSGSIDLTNCYMPETTWVFYGQMHGQNYWDSRARELTIKLLTTDEITDVYSSPEFPQFIETAQVTSDISLTLDDHPELVLDTASGEIKATLTNHSRLHTMRLKGIRFENVPYKISGVPRVLLPGQSAAVRLTPTGETHGKYGKIMIDYNEIPNIKFSKTRAECVTVL